jgi:hypothetical protein
MSDNGPIIIITGDVAEELFQVSVTFSTATKDYVFDSPALVTSPPTNPAQWAVVLAGLAQLTLDDDARDYLRDNC